MKLFVLVFFSIISSCSYTFGQLNSFARTKSIYTVKFECASKNFLAIDNLDFKKWNNYYKIENTSYYNSHLALEPNQTCKIKVIVNKKINNKNLQFYLEDSKTPLQKFILNDSTLQFNTPKSTIDYLINVQYKTNIISQLNIHTYSNSLRKIIVVPLIYIPLNEDSIRNKLNQIYKQVNLNFNVEINSKFSSKDFSDATLFNNPDVNYDHYTHQMRELRDVYFERHTKADKNAYYIFIINGFIDEKTNAFMARNKAFGFISKNTQNIYYQFARTLGYGLGSLEDSWANDGPEIGSTLNLMDTLKGETLTFFQWELIRQSSNSHLFYDAEEDIKTVNGRVAYYSWEEDEKGTIILQNDHILHAIKRPFKKNYLSYHLNIKDALLKPLFTIGKYFICWFHILFFSFLVSITIYFRRKWRRKIHILYKRPKLITKVLFIGLLAVNIIVYYAGFIFIHKQIIKHQITSGYLADLIDNTYNQAIHTIVENENIKRKDEHELKSEILLKRKNKWYMRTKSNVLYFSLKQDKDSLWSKCKFQFDSKILNVETQKFKEKVESHYMVFNYYDNKGEKVKQRVFTHNGTEITDKLQLNEDPAKRILLFVNGYRSTSIGRTFEESFADIQKNGLEFPNSNNLIYLFDRYDYWRPWNEIDLTFQKRINPTESYYADGHFSVETSNYESLIDFSSTSTIYPKRCSNKQKHHCKTVKNKDSFFSWFKSDKTIDLLPNEPNRKGFKTRLENGRIAGKNLLQMLNEIPNKSENDTVFIVAHSMGYAYSLGIIKELRGKINLGEFYIIAPENAESGFVNASEWKQIYQYGCNTKRYIYKAPCMLDGIAPQKKTNGLPNKNHIFIPEKYYNRHGFFDSHFIGYYTWIFDLNPEQAGYIRQR